MSIHDQYKLPLLLTDKELDRRRRAQRIELAVDDYCDYLTWRAGMDSISSPGGGHDSAFGPTGLLSGASNPPPPDLPNVPTNSVRPLNAEDATRYRRQCNRCQEH